MATRKVALYVGEKTLVDHFYLINVISQVSTRFKKIVSDKAFWEKESAWSLEELTLRDINMPWYTFQNAAIHRYLPNLRAFKMIRCTDESGASIMPPDLSQCQRLEEVRIAGNNVGYNAYCFPTDLGEQIPFPRGLKSLEVPNVVF